MESAGTAERAADLVSADGLAYVMHHDERGARSLAQSRQALAERRHRARVVFILVVRAAHGGLAVRGHLEPGRGSVFTVRLPVQVAAAAVSFRLKYISSHKAYSSISSLLN